VFAVFNDLASAYGSRVGGLHKNGRVSPLPRMHNLSQP
jgi:hypothetical protein